MPTLDEFYQFFDQELAPKIAQVDQYRNPASKANKAGAGLGCGVFITFIAAMLAGGFNTFVAILGLLTLISGYYWYKNRGKLKDYQKSFKEDLMRPMIQFISPEIQYHPEGYINKNIFKASMIFKNKSEHYHGDDLVSGVFQGNQVRFSELMVEYKSGKTKNTLFQGLFFTTDFNKDFDGYVMLLPKSKIIKGVKSASAYGRAEEQIKLENAYLMENFDCFSTNDILARYVLSFSLMEKIADFSKNYPNHPVYLSFVQGKMYLAIRHYAPLFEPKLAKQVDYKFLLGSYFHEITLALGIIEALDLDLRLWSKE